MFPEVKKASGYPIAVIAVTSEAEKIPVEISGLFRHEFAIEAPDESTRHEILKNLTEHTPLASDVVLKHLAAHTAALVAKDLVDLVAHAEMAAVERVLGCSSLSRRLSDFELVKAGVTIAAADFEKALDKARESYSDSIGTPKIPSVTWDDVGGLASVKSDILDTIQLPLDHPEMFASGLKKRSGILFYGPPGTGKTLLAKAVATSCSLNFFSVKGPELLNMYIGESEANVRRVFQRARSARPCVVFFDELDSIAPKRGQQGDSGGVMDRIVSQLLAELDGISDSGAGGGDVFVIGATNRPDLLDSALMRPGRFDKLIYLGVCEDHESQLKIIQALTRKFRLNPSVDLAKVVRQCPFHYTGADFYALCSDALLKAMGRVAGQVEDKVASLNKAGIDPGGSEVTLSYFLDRMATEEDTRVEVREEDFVDAFRGLVPSVTPEELQRYKRIQDTFSTAVAGSIGEPQARPSPRGNRKGKGKAEA